MLYLNITSKKVPSQTYFLILLVFLNVSNLSACQPLKLDSTELDTHYIITKAKEKLQNLNLAFGFIGETRPSQGKEKLIKKLLKEFHPEATIQVINSTGKITTYSMAFYLRNVLNRKYKRMYHAIRIYFASFDVDNLRPHPTEEDTYFIDFWFDQSFCGSYSLYPSNLNNEISMVSEDRFDYCDRTIKKGTMKAIRMNDPLGRSQWLIQYQSIDVVELKDVQK